MDEKLTKIQTRFEELERLLQSGELVTNQQKLKEVSREYEELKDIIRAKKDLEKIDGDLLDIEKIIADNSDDAELKNISLEEKAVLTAKRDIVLKEIKNLLRPKDPNDKKDVIVEIRAGTGGDESALFAAEMFRAYSRFAEKNHWKVALLSSNHIGIGGFKEVIFEIKGKDVYGTMKYESGVHRVQRVPETEKKGRVHTSTITVAVLPEAEEVDLVIEAKDLRIDTFCSGGAGGQSVNTTYSAVRITHLPTNTVVSCQDERSQAQNKEKAMMILRSRIIAAKEEEEAKKLGEARKSQIGTGERSEKIRTYNFPQDRITDHRIGENFSNISNILEGNLNIIIDAIKERAEEEII